MDLYVKDSGGKTSPQSDLREGNSSRRMLKKNTTGKRIESKVNNVVRIGTWNVRTLLQTGKLENAKQEMIKNKLDLMGMCEVRWKDSGEVESGDYTLYYSGGEARGLHGVGVLVTNKIKQKVMKIEYVNERIMMIRIKGNTKDLVIIQVYMPTSQHSEDEVEECYEKIEEISNKERRNACVIVMGDYNAVVGEGSEDKVVGRYGLGRRNDRGQKMFEYCKRNNMVIGNTLFENNKRRRYTWRSSLNNERYQIDYIIVQQRYRNSLKSAKSYPGADINSDHNLVIAEFYVRLKKIKKYIKKKEEVCLEKLKDPQKAQDLEDNLLKEMSAEGSNQNNNKEWENIRNGLMWSAKEVLGSKCRRKARKEWVTKEMLDKMEERRKWKNSNTEEGRKRYRKLNNELRRETKKAKEKWVNETCSEIERLEKEGRYEQMYKEAKRIVLTNKTSRGGMMEIEKADGEVVNEPHEVKKVWEEYIKGLYDWRHRPEECAIEIEKEHEVQKDQLGISILEVELERAIKEMKSRKAVGVDELPIELIKALQGEGKKKFMELCKNIYLKGEWPKDYTETILVPIEKKKNAKKCEDYRTLSLISHAAKVMLRVINRRLEGNLKNKISDEQFGFRRGVGTRDAIGVLRVIGERYIEKNRKVYAVFVDLEKAFDRVQWDKLLKILKNHGLDWRERKLIKELYYRQKAKVRIGSELTEEIGIGRGVRQGCCMSPILFNLYLEEIIRESLNGKRGVNVGGRRVECLRFADDMVILAESKKILSEMIQDLNNKLEEYGMRINKKKTKFMIIGGKGEKAVMTVDGEVIEQVSAFKYLGTIITEDMCSTTEIRTRIAIAKNSFNQKKNLFCGPLNRELRKRLVKCFIWSIALYGAETWTLRKDEERKLEALEMWIWRRMEGVTWRDKITNVEVLRKVGEDRRLLKTIKKRKEKWIGHNLRHDGLLRTVLEGMVKGKRKKGRKRYQLLDNIKNGKYASLKNEAQDRERWRLRP